MDPVIEARQTALLADLKHDPSNPRVHDEANLTVLMGCFRDFGQQIPLVVDENNVIIKGNGSAEAMRRLGWTEAWIVRTSLKGAKLIAYGIADNHASDTSRFDDPLLKRALEGLAQLEGSDLKLTGFTDKDLERIFGTPSLPPVSQPAATPGGG